MCACFPSSHICSCKHDKDKSRRRHCNSSGFSNASFSCTWQWKMAQILLLLNLISSIWTQVFHTYAGGSTFKCYPTEETFANCPVCVQEISAFSSVCAVVGICASSTLSNLFYGWTCVTQSARTSACFNLISQRRKKRFFRM